MWDNKVIKLYSKFLYTIFYILNSNSNQIHTKLGPDHISAGSALDRDWVLARVKSSLRDRSLTCR